MEPVSKLLIRQSSTSELAEVRELASIFRILHRREVTEADLREEIRKIGASFGMLDAEVDIGIDRLVGLIMEKAGHPGNRIVWSEEINSAFAGYRSPYRLLSKHSVQLRCDDTAQYKRRETDRKPTIPRKVAEDIARAVFEHPVVVVVGDGGCGKSVALSDAVTIWLQDEDNPPGFCWIVPALQANPEAMMNAVARSRNLAQHADGQDYRRSIRRLRQAYSDNPLLVICIDALDEKDGKSRLPDQVQRFVQELMDEATESRQKQGLPVVAVVVACRRITELENLSRGHQFGIPYHRIDVAAFDDDDLDKLIGNLDGDVQSRIAGHLQLPRWQTSRLPYRSERSVSADVMNVIRHPVMWRLFSESEPRVQDACLDDVLGLDQLGGRYLDWFRRKAEIRISGLRQGECSAALLAVCERFKDNPARVADRANDWINPCTNDAGCCPLNAGQLLTEAITAGIVVEEESDGRRWRWKHKWFCEYLLREGMNRV